MNKIFLILVLIASSYGYSLFRPFGVGASDCSSMLDASDKGMNSVDFSMYGIYAQGVFVTMNSVASIGGLAGNFEEFNYKKLETPLPMLKRVLDRYCDNNLTQNYHTAVVDAWMENAK